MAKETKTAMFLRLAAPDENGVSRWVSCGEFVGEFADLKFGNGASWARKESTLAKKYKIEFDKTVTSGNGIDRVRLNGFNNGDYSQHIRPDIKREISSRRCVVLGTSNFKMQKSLASALYRHIAFWFDFPLVSSKFLTRMAFILNPRFKNKFIQ